jgi:hypothetical protein
MNEFLRQMIAFLQSKFDNDSDFKTAPKVYMAYLYNHMIKGTEVQVGLLDNSEVLKYSTFEGEQVASMPTQITIYSAQMTIGGQMRNPQEVAMIMTDKICRYMKDCDFTLFATRESTTQPMPLDTGTTSYFVAIRYDIEIVSPYQK